ncbi:GSK3B-interacting protein isoform X3 [Dromiciops gliroides]|uniref:GSK3B-interacting protein isoform X3 n=1 Tax=Dromiciops gliroides TaxID=33562 RepID=UPI001CC3543E|nr:GSK3B-interacting protein isoform X3 [Dromiciops gliroides]
MRPWSASLPPAKEKTPGLALKDLRFMGRTLLQMETDYNHMELSSNTGIEEDSEFQDFERTDVKDMRLEAEAVVNDVLFAVSNMFVSKSLPCSDDVAYINVETREGNKYCLELSEAGLRETLARGDTTTD